MNNELNTTEQQKDFDVKSFSEKPKQFYKNLPKWAKFLIWVLVIFIAIKGVSYTFSAERLEKRLENNAWYSTIEVDNKGTKYEYQYAHSILFEKDGDIEYFYHNKGERGWYSDKLSVSDWKILDDKTLVLNDERLTFAKDWELSGGKLYIKTGKYEGVYSKTKPW